LLYGYVIVRISIFDVLSPISLQISLQLTNALKEYFNPKKYTIQNKHLCKINVCIGHKTDDGVL